MVAHPAAAALLGSLSVASGNVAFVGRIAGLYGICRGAITLFVPQSDHRMACLKHLLTSDKEVRLPDQAHSQNAASTTSKAKQKPGHHCGTPGLSMME